MSVSETKEGGRFKKAIAFNAKQPYKCLQKEKELVGLLITQGTKKHCYTGNCPLNLASRRPLATFARAVSWEFWDLDKRELKRGRV